MYRNLFKPHVRQKQKPLSHLYLLCTQHFWSHPLSIKLYLAAGRALHTTHHRFRRLDAVFRWTSMVWIQRKGTIDSSCYTFASNFEPCRFFCVFQESTERLRPSERNRPTSEALLGTALMNMYCKYGDIAQVEGVFQKMVHRDIVLWTTMVTAYVELGMSEKALQLYCRMLAEGITPDDRVFVFMLQACGILAGEEGDGQGSKLFLLEIGRALHSDARKCGCSSNVYVSTTLVSMYGKCGAIDDAEEAFALSTQQNVATWNAMLTTYVELQLGEEALCLYWMMLKENVLFDFVTFICILQACCDTGSLEACKKIHFDIESSGYYQDPSVVSTLIHGYGCCGGMESAEATFEQLLMTDVVSWSACIAGHAGKGDSSASVELLEKMQLLGIQPNEVTFSSVLTACSHTGLLAEGFDLFTSVSQKATVAPDLKHYNCMIDLFGRAGNFRGLQHVLDMMPIEGDLTFWLCLLCVCRIHGNVEIAKQAFDHALKIQPDNAAAYIILSNICMAAGLQESVDQLKRSMRLLGLEEAWQEVE